MTPLTKRWWEKLRSVRPNVVVFAVPVDELRELVEQPLIIARQLDEMASGSDVADALKRRLARFAEELGLPARYRTCVGCGHMMGAHGPKGCAVYPCECRVEYGGLGGDHGNGD